MLETYRLTYAILITSDDDTADEDTTVGEDTSDEEVQLLVPSSFSTQTYKKKFKIKKIYNFCLYYKS